MTPEEHGLKLGPTLIFAHDMVGLTGFEPATP